MTTFADPSTFPSVFETPATEEATVAQETPDIEGTPATEETAVVGSAWSGEGVSKTDGNVLGSAKVVKRTSLRGRMLANGPPRLLRADR